MHQRGHDFSKRAAGFHSTALLTGIVLLCAITGPVRGDDDAPSPIKRAEGLINSGRYDAAIRAFERLTSDDGRRLRATLGIAGALELRGDYAEAIDRLEQVAEVGEHDADWQHRIGRIKRAIGRYDEAADHFAKAIELDGSHLAARFEQANLAEYLGRHDEAIRGYAYFEELLKQALPDSAPDLVSAGRGLYRHTVLARHEDRASRITYVLQELYQHAYEKADARYWPGRIAAANLLLEKHNLDEAKEDFEAALKINDRLASAWVGLGRIALEKWDLERAEKSAKHALAANPHSAAARRLMARLRLTERRYDDAAEEARTALEVNPNDLTALSLLAAAKLRAGDEPGSQEAQRRALALNPRCARLYFELGEALSAGRQFQQAERHYRKAIERFENWADPRVALGLMYMQTGEETKARAALEAAWEIDRYDRKARNTLDLLDELDKFTRHETEHFVMKTGAKRDAVLGLYFGEYLESIYDEVCEDYGADLKPRTIVEVFPSRRQFGVRITGRPWIHTVGASTGRVIALDSPHRDADGQRFNWTRVLKHELTHTVTLAVTRNRIPQWLTEGLAVLAEDAPRAWEWTKLLAIALRRDRLHTLAEIDWAFVHPRRPNDQALAYAQSEWMCEFLIATHGYGVIGKLLAGFREGRTQSAVLKDATGLEPAEWEKAFQTWAKGQVKSWGLSTDPIWPEAALRAAAIALPRSPSPHADLAQVKLLEGNLKQAELHARKALDIDPKNPVALRTICRALFAASGRVKREATARRIRQEVAAPLVGTLLEVRPDDWQAVKFNAGLAAERGQREQAIEGYRRLKALCPVNPASYRELAKLYLQAEDLAAATPELIALARFDEHNAELPAKIADIAESRGRIREAMTWLRRAIHIDPYAIETHESLARIAEQEEAWEVAVRERRALAILEPQNASRQTALALVCEKAGRRDLAEQAARRAVELNPNSR